MSKISKGSAEHYIWGAGNDGWHLVKGQELSVIHERMLPGTSEVRHSHEYSRQFFFILSGTVTIEVDGEVEELAAHEGIEVPPGVAHQVMNKSEEDVEFLVISQPTSRVDRIEKLLQ